MNGPVIPAARCSTCAAWADTAHLLPWVTRTERVEFACPEHDPGGYTIALDAWGRPASDTLWTHIADKHGGLRAVAALARALADQEDRLAAEDGEYDARDPGTLLLISGAEILEQGGRRERAFDAAITRDREPRP